MPMSIPEFWKLAVDGQLLTPDQCQQLGVAFGRVKGASHQGNALTLAEWLISRNVLTRYQTTILLAGHAGPFFYGDYKLYDRVPGGPLAGMFRAVHAATNHPVLLRFVTGPAVQDPQHWQPLAALLRAHCGLVQANVQRCYELVDLEAYRFLVLEDLAGRWLPQALEGDRRLPPAEVCRIIRAAAQGLDALHRKHLAHGDVRPSRLWLEQGGNVRLLRDPLEDLAPIHFLQPDPQGLLLARADYLAPDFLQINKTADALTDLYALGCTFYHLLAGQPPFPGGDLRQKMQQHAGQPIQPLEALGVPKAISDIVTYLMAKNPAVRFQSAAQVVVQLTPLVDPARLQLGPPAPPATLAAYDQLLRRRMAASVSPAAPGAGPQPVAAARPAAGAAAAAAPVVAVSPAAAPAVEGVLPTAPAGRGGRVRARKRMPPTTLIGIGIGSIAAFLLLILILVGMFGGDDRSQSGSQPPSEAHEPSTPEVEPVPESATPAAPQPAPATPSGATPDAAADAGATPAGRFLAVADDGTKLWIPPSAGSAADLRYAPPGSQFYLLARPADLLAGSEGGRALQALGPAMAAAQQRWEAAAGLPLAAVESLVLTLHDGDPGFPLPALVVRLKQAADKTQLVRQWGNPAPVTQGAAEYYPGRNGWTFYVPADGEGRVFVMGPEPQIKQVLEFGGDPPALRPAMSKLLAATDNQRHLTILFSPNDLVLNLFRDGRQLSFAQPQQLRDSLEWFLGDGVEAGLFSAHLADYTYAELVLIGAADRPTKALAEEFRQRLEQLPDLVQRQLGGLDPGPYWNQVAERFPQMLRYVSGQVRVGSEGELTVINAVAPPQAAHNLAFAAAMMLASSPGAMSSGPAPAATMPASLAELLERKLTIRFAQDSLESALANIENEVRDAFPNLPFPWAIRILGADLEKNGITRNQQIRDFDQTDKTIAEILTAMVQRANPKAVTGPRDVNQQLVWVIGPDPDQPGRTILLITTRDAAAEKQYPVPAVFQP